MEKIEDIQETITYKDMLNRVVAQVHNGNVRRVMIYAPSFNAEDGDEEMCIEGNQLLPLIKTLTHAYEDLYGKSI